MKERGANRNPSRAAVIKNNDRIATKKLTRLMNANFYPGDLHLVLTYAGEAPSIAEANNEIENFKRRMKREYAKQGKEFRWIEVTEYENHRPHHHMLVSYIDAEIVAKQWKRGHVRAVVLDRTRNYQKLAEYFLKETTKTMRIPGAETKQIVDKYEAEGKCYIQTWIEITPEEHIGYDIRDEYEEKQ